MINLFFLVNNSFIQLTNWQLPHGDADHMAESINLIKNYKVDKVIFNCGDYNNLEVNLIKELNDRKIEYKSCIKELNIDSTKFFSSNKKIW